MLDAGRGSKSSRMTACHVILCVGLVHLLAPSPSFHRFSFPSRSPRPWVTFAVLFYLPEGEWFWITGLINKVNTDRQPLTQRCADRAGKQRSSWGARVQGPTVELLPGHALTATSSCRGLTPAFGRVEVGGRAEIHVPQCLHICQWVCRSIWVHVREQSACTLWFKGTAAMLLAVGV